MIRKAVIPAAGMGTRFLPATKSMPKEMLPIIDKPVIQFVVEEAILSGIEDIIIITGRGKRAIEDYFDILTPEIFDCIKETPPGKGNEIQLTDAIRKLIKEEDVYGYAFTGKRYDAGDKIGYVKAIIDFALEREALKGEIEGHLRER